MKIMVQDAPEKSCERNAVEAGYVNDLRRSKIRLSEAQDPLVQNKGDASGGLVAQSPSTRADPAFSRENCVSNGHALEFIEDIRWCLVSGGSYKHENVTKVEVARATIRGMRRAQLHNYNLTATFINDDDAFARAYQEEDLRTDSVLLL